MTKKIDEVGNAEKEAAILLNQAVSLSQASIGNNVDKIKALDSNLKMWVEIETTLKNAKNLLPEDIKNNLLKLSKYVERLTLSKGVNMSKSDFDFRENGAVFLSDAGRRTFLQRWQERKRETITHPYLREKLSWGLVPYIQALLFARTLRGDLDGYPPFLWK